MEQITQHLDKLPAFVTVAESNSLSRAAKQLGRTRQGVAYSIDVLEKLIGNPLFRRSHTGLELTLEGIRFLEFAQSIIRMAEAYEARRMQDSEATVIARSTTPVD